MAKLTIRKFASPDENRQFTDKGHAEILDMGGGTVGRGVFEPGWKWSKHVKPIAKTESCEAAHSGYVAAGRMHIVMDDGQEADIEAGDYVVIPPGHDAWTVGNETCVFVDFVGMGRYAQAEAGTRAQAGSEQQPGVH